MALVGRDPDGAAHLQRSEYPELHPRGLSPNSRSNLPSLLAELLVGVGAVCWRSGVRSPRCQTRRKDEHARSGSFSEPPQRNSGTAELHPVLAGYCSFPITIDAQVDFVITDFVDTGRVLARRQLHIHEHDVFTANRVSLTGAPFSFTLDFYFAPDGTLTKAKSIGVAETLRLPDGTLFIVAGYLDILTTLPGTEFFLFVNHGNPGDRALRARRLWPLRGFAVLQSACARAPPAQHASIFDSFEGGRHV
jgi:hypothetical protein